MKNTFLTADWRKLAMINYEIDPAILAPFGPHKTELDFYNGKCFVSLIGFRFLETKIKGFKIPFHINFTEVNLRFYVRYQDGDIWKRGTVFIKEMVPKYTLTFVANTVYGEHYETLPMKHLWLNDGDSQTIAYKSKNKSYWNSISVKTDNKLHPIVEGSEEEFISEHYWGYTKIKNNKTSEYAVEHPRWEVYETKDVAIDVNFKDNYGAAFAFLQNQKPSSVFVAEGSIMEVKTGKIL